MTGIVSLDPREPGGFAPLLAGALDAAPLGAPLLLGYELGGVACAALAADCLERSVTLLHVAVDGPCRGRGMGGLLVDALCGMAARASADQVDAVVCLPPERLAEVSALLSRRYFFPRERSQVCRFPISSVLTGPLAPAVRTPDRRAVPLYRLPAYQLRAFNHRLSLPDGPPYPPIRPEELLTDASMAWVEKGQVTGCVLLAPCGNDVELRWLHGQGPAPVRALLAASCAALAAQRDPDTVVHAAALGDGIYTLIQKLAGPGLTEEDPVVHFCRRL